MLPGDFDHSMDLRELDTYAVVNGVPREIESVSLDAELTGDLPDQVVSAGGVSGRTGTIVWTAQDDAVAGREVSPWHKPSGWPPSAGDRVQIYATDGVTSYPRFTGVIDQTTGSVGTGYQSRIIDLRDRLNESFTHKALLRHHTPHQEGWAYRSIGLNFWYFLVAALRQSRIYNVPEPTAEIALSMPLQGSVWAEAGTVTTAHAHSGTGNHAMFHVAPWGYASGGFRVAWLPRTSYTTSQPLQITMMVAPDHDGDARIDVFYGDTSVRLRAFRDRRVTAYVGDSSVVSLSPSAMSGTNIVTLLIKNGVWELRNDAGRGTTGQASIPGSAAMSNGEIVAEDGARIAGLQVSRPNTTAHEFAPTRFTPNMRFHPGFLASTMDMSPRIENRNVADLVDEITKSTLTAAWWDETGILNLVSTERLWNAEPVQTVTSLDDITELSWEDSLLSVRSLVKVDWKNPSISKSRYRRKELFRGPGDSMESQDIYEVFATPDNDTEWFGVDRSPRLLDDTNWGVYNRKRGSFMGVYYMNDNDQELATSSRTTTITTENLGTAAIKITHRVGVLGTGVEANLGTSENSTAIRSALRGDNLPVIRGFGEGKWVDDVTESSTTGPSSAPTLTHDLGYWGQEYFDGDTVARRIGDFIAQQVTTPKPTIRSMSVTYDPRRQLGDTITIELGILGVRLRALIVGISESHQPGAYTQQLTVRIIFATSTRDITYEELQAAWGSGNYDGLQAVWQNLTYTTFENDPLEGAPE